MAIYQVFYEATQALSVSVSKSRPKTSLFPSSKAIGCKFLQGTVAHLQ